MRTGTLRSRVSIQRELRTPDDRLGATVTWPVVCEVACSVDDQWALERVAAGGLEAASGHAIIIRYREGIDAGMRAVVTAGPGTGGPYNIRGVLRENARGTSRPELLILDCEKGVAV